ncbi:MAG: hypothetical protein IT427_06185 [Pirellulales bacterium]|nr:hypothetical protein [Pirellulales bacterium]
MKHIIIIAASLGLSASLATAALAEGPNVFGEAAPNQNVVQPEQSRGQLGGLASGAPSFATNLKDLRGPGGVTAAAAAAQPAATAIAQTQTQTAVQTQTVAVESHAIKPIQSFHQLAMVIHHCIANSPRKFPGGPIPFSTTATPLVAASARSPGDLEIAGIGMVVDASPQQGPLYRVTIRNNSETPSRHFEVSLIAVRGQLNPLSPVTTVHVAEIPAGGVQALDVQLPLGVMSLNFNNQAGPFESLVVAIDSFDELMETSELNNVAVLTRGQVALIETATATTATTTTAAAVATTAPATSDAPATAAPTESVVPGTTAPATAPSTTDSAAPAPGDATVAPQVQPNAAPQAPATGNAPSAQQQAPQAGANDSDLESLVPQQKPTGGM